MMSRETAERYRRMTNGERFQITLDLIEENWPYLFKGSPEVVARRLELLRRQNEERNRLYREAFARAGSPPCKS